METATQKLHLRLYSRTVSHPVNLQPSLRIRFFHPNVYRPSGASTHPRETITNMVFSKVSNYYQQKGTSQKANAGFREQSSPLHGPLLTHQRQLSTNDLFTGTNSSADNEPAEFKLQ